MVVEPLPLEELRTGDVLHAGILSNGHVMSCLIVDIEHDEDTDTYTLHVLNGRYADALDGVLEAVVTSHRFGNQRGTDQFRTILDNGITGVDG